MAHIITHLIKHTPLSQHTILSIVAAAWDALDLSKHIDLNNALQCQIYFPYDTIYYTCEDCVCQKGGVKILCSQCMVRNRCKHSDIKREFGKGECCGRALHLQQDVLYNSKIIILLDPFISEVKTLWGESDDVVKHILMCSVFELFLKLITADKSFLNPVIELCMQVFYNGVTLLGCYFVQLALQETLPEASVKIMLMLIANSKQCYEQIFLSWFHNYSLIIKNWKSSMVNGHLREAIFGMDDFLYEMLSKYPYSIESIFTCFICIVGTLKHDPSLAFTNEINFMFDDMNILIKSPKNSILILTSTRFFDLALQTTILFGYTNMLSPLCNNPDNSVFLHIFFLSMKCKRAISYFFIDKDQKDSFYLLARKYHYHITKDYEAMLQSIRYYGFRYFTDPTYSLAFEFMTFPLCLLPIQLPPDQFLAQSKKLLCDIHSQVDNFSLEQYLGIYLSDFLQYLLLVSECSAGKWKYNNIEELYECMILPNGTIERYSLFIQYICAMCEEYQVVENVAQFLLNLKTLSIESVLQNLNEGLDNSVIIEEGISYLTHIATSSIKFMEERISTYYVYNSKEIVDPKDEDDIMEYYKLNFALSMCLRSDLTNIDVYNICNELPKDTKIEGLIDKAIKQLFIYKDGKVTISSEIINYINIFDIPVPRNASKCDSTKRKLLKKFPQIKAVDYFANKVPSKYRVYTNEILRKIRCSSTLLKLIMDIIICNSPSITDYTRICCIKLLDSIYDEPITLEFSQEYQNSIYLKLKLIASNEIIYKPAIKKLIKKITPTIPNVTRNSISKDIKNNKKIHIQKNKDDILRKFHQLNQQFISTNSIRITQSNSDCDLLCSFCKEPIALNNIDEPFGIISSINPSILGKSMIKFLVLSSQIVKADDNFKAFVSKFPFVMKKRHWEIECQNIFNNSHFMHYKCFRIMRSSSSYLYKCPVCRRVANCLIPCISNKHADLLDLRKNTLFSKMIIGFLSDIKLLSANPSLSNTKFMRYNEIETRKKLKDYDYVMKFALSLLKMLNRVSFLVDNSIYDDLVSKNTMSYSNICTILKVLLKYASDIKGLPYNDNVDYCVSQNKKFLRWPKYLWILDIIGKCLKLPTVDIKEQIDSLVFYMLDFQLLQCHYKFTTRQDAYDTARKVISSDHYSQLLSLHLNRVWVLLDFFHADQSQLSKNNDVVAINGYESKIAQLLQNINNNEYFEKWKSEVNERASTSELYYYLFFTTPYRIKSLLKRNYIDYFERCYLDKPAATGSNSEKYICLACNKIISISEDIEQIGVYPTLINHCAKCLKSQGMLINVRFGRMLVLTSFNGYELNLPYYNKLGMCIASYLEDSTTVIDVEKLTNYQLNYKESQDILQCIISGDDISNTNAIKGGTFIEVFNLLN